MPATTGIRNEKGQWVPGTTGNPNGNPYAKSVKEFTGKLISKFNAGEQWDHLVDELIWLGMQRDNLKEKNIALTNIMNRILGCPKSQVEVEVQQGANVDPRDIGAVLLTLRGAINEQKT